MNEPKNGRGLEKGKDSQGSVPPHPVISKYYRSSERRQEWVDQAFDASAPYYDRITDVMSFGSGRWYRKWALYRHGLRPGMRFLDVGAGTGVIARAAQDQVGPEGEVVALDPSNGMLEQAHARGVSHTVKARAEDMPFADSRFEMMTMGYALRHVADLQATFAGYHRSLSPGGKVLLLEITPPRGRLGYKVLKFYLRRLVPLLARLFSRSRDAQVLMNYYWDTIENCVPPETIQDALREAGFQNVDRHVVFGLFSEYSGVKPPDGVEEGT